MSLPLFVALADVPPTLLAPFALLLFLIAVMPLSPPAIKHRWDAFYPFVSVGLATLVAAYYFFRMPEGAKEIGRTAADYFSFISLIGSLFVIAGGIHLKVKGEATPGVNVLFLIGGAIVANIIGTTGASMMLIRPWIRMNKIRASAYHVVFFIFIVSNVGGSLTPIGDPPLFLGYLRGVPFFWLSGQVLAQWVATVGAILGVFYFFDARGFRHMPRKLQNEISAQTESWRFDGRINVLFLGAVIGAVFLPDKYFLREAVMGGAALGSWFCTPKFVHAENQFSFGPIKEVALLFIGIFGTMLPALDYLALHGQQFGFTQPLHYYFASGALSSVLDNAPTYVNFLQLAQTTAIAEAPGFFSATVGDTFSTTRLLLAHDPQLVVGVSLGAVFFGAMTYIGNGPNFMVKAIAHDTGVHCPTFFGYVVKYSLPILLPILAISGWLFLR